MSRKVIPLPTKYYLRQKSDFNHDELSNQIQDQLLKAQLIQNLKFVSLVTFFSILSCAVFYFGTMGFF